MSVLVILLLVSIGIAVIFFLAFFWSVKDGQFDDDFSPARRILFKNENEGEGGNEQGITNKE